MPNDPQEALTPENVKEALRLIDLADNGTRNGESLMDAGVNSTSLIWAACVVRHQLRRRGQEHQEEVTRLRNEALQAEDGERIQRVIPKSSRMVTATVTKKGRVTLPYIGDDLEEDIRDIKVGIQLLYIILGFWIGHFIYSAIK